MDTHTDDLDFPTIFSVTGVSDPEPQAGDILDGHRNETQMLEDEAKNDFDTLCDLLRDRMKEDEEKDDMNN